jgi:mannan endo-1,4-beta-mannosidase
MVSEASLADPNVDFVQTHHYDKDPRDMVSRVLKNGQRAAGRKPYHVGEFGFLGTEGHRAVIDTVIREKFAGALLWSLRYRSRDGGFYWHHEPFGGDLFKAYHWPGFEMGESFDERGMVRLMREKAYEIRGLKAPPLAVPQPPRLLSVTDGGEMCWQGSVGAELYDVQRSPASVGDLLAPRGQWETIAESISECRVQFRPLFVDETARPQSSYRYRVIARNESGASAPSNEVGPVTIAHRTLVDEMWNNSRIFLTEGKTQFVQNDARKFKEDCHRLAGEKGASVAYFTAADIHSAKIFAFTLAKEPNLRLSISRDGRTYEPIVADSKRTITYGVSAYDFWMADLYSVTLPGPGYMYLRIEYLGDAQLSRVEIEHG